MAYASYTGTLTCTLASLADTSARQSAALDLQPGGAVVGAGEVVVDVVMHVKLTSTSTPNSKAEVYVAGEFNGLWQDGATGSDAAFTAANIDNLPLAAAIDFNGGANTRSGIFGVAQLFRGALPDQVSVVVLNESGQTFNATGGNHEIAYRVTTVS